ncbi:protein ninE [Escherichia coli O121:H19 str. 2011C-3609]|nr:protein ninE [Escherichia coli O121:H19 str. 2011C-3609]
MRRQRRSFTDIICENCKYLPTKRSRNKRKPIPKESDVKTEPPRFSWRVFYL